MHSEYTATETVAKFVANLADPGSAARKQAREAAGCTPSSSIHPQQAMRPSNHETSPRVHSHLSFAMIGRKWNSRVSGQCSKEVSMLIVSHPTERSSSD